MANAVDQTVPQNSESPTLGAQRIRETRSGFNNLLTVEHDISDSATTKGFHGTNITGKVDTSISTPPSGYGRFGWKTIGGVAELFYRDDAGNEKQITSAGKLLSQLQDTDTDLSGKSYFLDEDDMSSDDAIKVASQQSVKAYVDAQNISANGAIKAWVNFNGNTGAIRTQYNVSSVTRNGVGDYTINFTNNFAASTSIIPSGWVADGTAAAGFVCNEDTSSPFAVGSAQISTIRFSTGAKIDYDIVCVMFAGN
jgi:hypothetical protein